MRVRTKLISPCVYVWRALSHPHQPRYYLIPDLHLGSVFIWLYTNRTAREDVSVYIILIHYADYYTKRHTHIGSDTQMRTLELKMAVKRLGFWDDSSLTCLLFNTGHGQMLYVICDYKQLDIRKHLISADHCIGYISNCSAMESRMRSF